MSDDRYAIVRMTDGSGMGIVKSLGTHISRVEFNAEGHHWSIIVDNEDFEIVGYIGHKEVQ